METKQAIGALSALAQESRLAIYRLLVEHGPSGMCAGAIAEALALPASSLSFHLAHLSRAGLIDQKRASRQIIYSADVGAMNALVAYLTENCCGGKPELCAPACAPASGESPSTKAAHKKSA